MNEWISEAQFFSIGRISPCPRGLNWGFSSCHDPNHPRQEETPTDGNVQTCNKGSCIHQLPHCCLQRQAKPRCLEGTVPRDPAPQWSLSPVTPFGSEGEFQASKGNKCGFFTHPSPSAENHLLSCFCLHPFLPRSSAQLELEVWPQKVQSIPHGAPGPAPSQPLLTESAVVLGLRKTSSDISKLHQSWPFLLSLCSLWLPLNRAVSRDTDKKHVVWREKVAFFTAKRAVFCLSTRGLLFKLRHDLWPRLSVQTHTSNKHLCG